MEMAAVGFPRAAWAAARRTGRAVAAVAEAVPRIAHLLAELRETGRQLERLATFAAQELPEIVYQLEAIRDQLTAIERRLAAGAVPVVTPGSPRNDSPRPS
ncbi:hypothetical protein B0I33_108283 [Prauserella shujinwangii]|uniref:Uncharacterized protein n=1 Tax=Prauserella shujinwangii TaxID=1453103 RepID=A0A2T0LRL1_9PSEU|nr:hypothetical protein [Prauserella shujinwangii]PRX46136.1 hypothetical protein B0I33_108283 [Prauserella shujinwangii]